jgi:hypothetical protein
MYYYDANASDVNSDVLSWYLEGNCTVYLVINSATGVVNGSLPIMGYWFVNISASDSWSTIWQNVSVCTLNAAPYFTTSPILVGTVNVSYYYHANAHDNNSDTLVYSLVDSPEWAFVDPSTGEVEGTSTLPGDYDFHLRVWDGYVFTWQNWTQVDDYAPPPAPPTPPSGASGISLLIMLGVIGLGALVVMRRMSERGKPAKKPEPNKEKKEKKK